MCARRRTYTHLTSTTGSSMALALTLLCSVSLHGLYSTIGNFFCVNTALSAINTDDKRPNTVAFTEKWTCGDAYVGRRKLEHLHSV